MVQFGKRKIYTALVVEIHENNPEGGLLNGPQLPCNAISQNDIDKLMSNS